MDTYKLPVEGMTCTDCEAEVASAVESVDGVYRVEADHQSGEVEVTTESGNEDTVRQAIHDAGYDVSA